MGKAKLTKLGKHWILYDVGNSAFVLLAATILPIYFNYLAELDGLSKVDYTAYWGYAASISMLLVVVVGPIFGILADTKEYKKPILIIGMMVGMLGCAVLSVSISWVTFLVVFVVAKVGYSASLIFYDSMLTDVTAPERMDMVSSRGYAWRYIGSCIPFVVSLGLVLGYETAGISMTTAVAIVFVLSVLWWVGVTIPLLKTYRQIHHVETQGTHVMRESLGRLVHAFRDLKGHKNILVFLIALFFYIDGVYTIIEMATAYGNTLGLDTQGLLLALLLTQIVAFPFSILFGVLAKRYQTDKLIGMRIPAYTGIAIFAIQLNKQWEFWVLAVSVGMFRGGMQALSRSYFARIIPPEKSGEFFGIYDVCGKGASFMGTTLMGLSAQITGELGGGVTTLAVMLLIGYVLFRKAAAMSASKFQQPG